MKRLLAHGQFVGYPSRSFSGKPPALPALCNSVLPSHKFYSTEKHDETLSEIGEKARSTAEEFLRVAKDKTDEVSESAKEALHETKEAVVGESEEDKETFKRRVEEGKYHQK
ncbi:uncharacterized protein LOC133920376 isoform X1 [Phragmites australis]|uniref:uncharacterized protein LOC133920376 isoform X1 n=1 Tax=Phragmites australis TaxID=29695 RepID=UPI002D78105E|nr:uncharacterized protein LOC133920376 isoform X1 [Phragmites australis]